MAHLKIIEAALQLRHSSEFRKLLPSLQVQAYC